MPNDSFTVSTTARKSSPSRSRSRSLPASCLVRKDGNTLARKLYLSRPERNKGITLQYDDELKVWIKGGSEIFSEKKNCWEPFNG